MSLDPASIDRIPLWSAVVPAAALALAAVLFAGGAGVGPVLLLPASLLMLGTVFAAVRHAEVLALRLGEPYGSILLALAITLIEVTLIVSLMLAGGCSDEREGGEGRILRGFDWCMELFLLCRF